MKYLNPLRTGALLGFGLLVGATEAAADPSVQLTTAQNQTSSLGDLIGSDTLEDIARDVIANAPAISADNAAQGGIGIIGYLGLGSSAGQRQLIGAPSTGEPTCTTTAGTVNGDTNWGCEEVAPMSRQFNSAICSHDADDPRDADDSTTVNSTAEGISVGLDGLSVIADNAGHRQYATGTCVTPDTSTPESTVFGPSSDNSAGIPGANGYGGTGTLRNSGNIGAYQLGGGALAGDGWKDVLRLIYTGCRNDQGTCAATITRFDRCSPTVNTVRRDLVNSYANIFEGTDCPEANHCTQLRAAYRRDDASGTTGFILDTLGLRSGGSDLAARTRVSNPGGAGTNGFQTVPENIFCDGGQYEGLWPVPYTTGTVPVLTAVAAGETYIGDPLQRACAPEDDLCGPTGTIGLVRPIRSPRDFAYPAVQCTRNAFDRKPWPNTGTVPTCPDGTAPTLRGCYAPYYNAGGGSQNFDCMNPANSRNSQSPTALDGRVFNFIWRLPNGDLSNINHQQANSVNLPEIAQWRQNMATVNPGATAVAGGAFGSTTPLSTQSYLPSGSLSASFNKTYAGGVVCQQGSATDVIGCAVANTRCVIGYSGRETGTNQPQDDGNEFIRLGGFVPSNEDVIAGNYPITRSLFVNAIGGFESVFEDCLARQSNPSDPTWEYCQDELEFARRFYIMNSATQASVSKFGFIPIAANSAALCAGSTNIAQCVANMDKRWAARCVGATSGQPGTSVAGCGRLNTTTETLSSGIQLPHQDIERCDPDHVTWGTPEGPAAGLSCEASVSTSSGPAIGANNTCG